MSPQRHKREVHELLDYLSVSICFSNTRDDERRANPSSSMHRIQPYDSSLFFPQAGDKTMEIG